MDKMDLTQVSTVKYISLMHKNKDLNLELILIQQTIKSVQMYVFYQMEILLLFGRVGCRMALRMEFMDKFIVQMGDNKDKSLELIPIQMVINIDQKLQHFNMVVL